MTVREQMRTAYLRSGKTLVEIAVEAGVSENTILNVFRGRNVTSANLFALASALHIEAISVPVNSEDLGVVR